MNTPTQFWTFVESRCTALGITLSEFARRIDVSRPMVEKYKAGSLPSTAKLPLVAEALAIDMVELMRVIKGGESGAHIAAASVLLTETLDYAERNLRALKMSTSADVPIEVDGVLNILSFRKVNNRWGLFWVDPEGFTIAIKDANLRVRLEAAKAIPALVDAMHKARGDLIAEIHRVTAELNVWLDTNLEND